MYSDEDDDKTAYDVVVNHEEQYSIWPADREMCPGWKAAGKTGLKPECLEYISDVWTDMRPLSLRKQMEEMEARRPEIEAEDARRIEEENAKPKDPRDDLVAFLSDGDHPVARVRQIKVMLDPGEVARARPELAAGLGIESGQNKSG